MSAAPLPPLTTARKALVGGLLLVDALWLLASIVAVSLLDSFDYGRRYQPAWRYLVALLVAAAPVVVLVRSRGRRLLLATGVFLAGALLFFGVCVVGA